MFNHSENKHNHMPQFILLLFYCNTLHSIYKLITNWKHTHTMLELKRNLRNVVQLYFIDRWMKQQETGNNLLRVIEVV